MILIFFFLIFFVHATATTEIYTLSLHDALPILIPHQPNIRILKSLAERVNLPFEKVYTTIQKYGNSSAASLPIALDEANREGRLQKDDLLLFSVFGGGFTWGVALWRW